MKTAEQIAEKLWEKYLHESLASRANFLAALKEYGELVRQRAAGVCRESAVKRYSGRHIASSMTLPDDCAAAIERMELP